MTGPGGQLVLISALVALIFSAQAAMPQVVLTPEEMRAEATKALRERHPAKADALARAMLVRDQDDIVAHMIRARAHRDMGQYDKARAFARQAWTLSDKPGEKYASALLMAQALSSDGKRTRAQFWLRRAVQHGPTKAHEAKAKRDFRYVQQRNPWQTHLSFTIAPNSNINNGSARDSSVLNYQISETLFGAPVEYALTGASRALSGLEIGGSLRSRYRFSQTATSAQDIKFGLSYRTFTLDSGSKAEAPGVTGSDFAYGTVSLGYGYRQINLDRKGEFAFDAELGQSWYGGQRYASYFRFSGRQILKRPSGKRLAFGLNAERQIGQATADVDTFGISARLTQRLSSGHLLFLGATGEVTQSDNAESEYGELAVQAGLVLRKPVMGAALQFGMGASIRDYDVSRHSRDGRRDHKLFADVTATFTEIDYYGFNPTLTLSAATTDSNIGLYDVNRVGLRVGFKSAF